MADEVLKEMADDAGIPYEGSVEVPDPEPEVTRNVVGDYLFTWITDNGEYLRITCADVGFTKGELQCRASVAYKKHKGAQPKTLMSRQRWIIESTSSRNSLITELKRWKISDLIERWHALLTSVSTYFEDNYETGDPLVWLDEVEDPGPLKYLVEPLIQAGEHTLVGARGGSLKSMTALSVCLTLVSQRTIIPGLEPRTDKPLRCLYLDYETNKSTHRRRLNLIAKAKGITIPPKLIGYKRLNTPLVQMKTELQRLIAIEKFEFVVVDSVGRAVGGETVGEADVQAYYNACSAFNVPIMSIGHTSKGNGDTVAGNAQWEFQARSMWIFEAAREHGSNSIVVGMHHRKVNEGELLPSLTYAVSFNDRGVSYAQADDRDVEQLSGVDLKTSIRIFLAEHPNSTAKEISDGLDNFEGSVERINNVLRQWAGNLWKSDGAKRNAKWLLLTPVSNQLVRGDIKTTSLYTHPVSNEKKEEAVRMPYRENDDDPVPQF